MNKKLSILGVIVALVAVLSGSVSAGLTTYTYTDVQTWADSGQLVSNGSPYVYLHDISSHLPAPGGYNVTNAMLTLAFEDDEEDNENNLKKNEDVTVSVWNWNSTNDPTGAISASLGEVDSGSYAGPSLTNHLSWLDDDGKLSVHIALDLSGQDVYLKSSILAVTYDVVPVPLPAPILLGVFAVGLAGCRLRKFM